MFSITGGLLFLPFWSVSYERIAMVLLFMTSTLRLFSILILFSFNIRLMRMGRWVELIFSNIDEMIKFFISLISSLMK